MAKTQKNKVQPPEDNLKFLKFIVHFMGILLIAGIVLLFILIIVRNQEKTSKNAENTTSECSNREFLVPERGKVSSVLYNSDGTITLVIDSENGQKILTLDRCSHKVLNNLTVKP